MKNGRPLRSTRRLQNITAGLPGWFSITNAKGDGGPAVVSIYDEIGMFGTSAQGFMDELSKVAGDVELHLNSPGGDVFDGIAIYNRLRQMQAKGTVRVIIDGLAASAASFVAMAASPGCLEIAPHAQVMIHEGFALGIGNAADLRDLARQLDKASDNIAGIYADRTGKPAAYWREKMLAETWYTDAEAVADGLADRIQGEEAKPGDWDLTVYGSARHGPASGPLKGKKGKKGGKGKRRYDPDGDGDNDATAAGDTDHDYVLPDGSPGPKAPRKKGGKGNRAPGLPIRAAAPDVDHSDWDGGKAMRKALKSDDPAAYFKAICAGRRAGDPALEKSWALPYRYRPDGPPNAAGVRDALSRLPQTQGLTNEHEARERLEGLMKQVNPDYKPGDHLDGDLLAAVFRTGLEGAVK